MYIIFQSSLMQNLESTENEKGSLVVTARKNELGYCAVCTFLFVFTQTASVSTAAAAAAFSPVCF